MTPVFQTIISDESKGIHGNCFPACLASLLDLNIEQVPQLQNMGTEWFPAFWDFLQKNNYTFYGTGNKEKVLDYNEGVDGYYIVWGSSPRGFKRGHSVIYKHSKLVHDPHISNLGIIEVWNFLMIERI